MAGPKLEERALPTHGIAYIDDALPAIYVAAEYRGLPTLWLDCERTSAVSTISHFEIGGTAAGRSSHLGCGQTAIRRFAIKCKAAAVGLILRVGVGFVGRRQLQRGIRWLYLRHVISHEFLAGFLAHVTVKQVAERHAPGLVSDG